MKPVARFGTLSMQLPPLAEAYAAGEKGEVHLEAVEGDSVAWRVELPAAPPGGKWLARFTHAWPEGDSLLVITHGEASRGATSHGFRLHRVEPNGKVAWSQDTADLQKGSLLHGGKLLVVALDQQLDAEHPYVGVRVLTLDWRTGRLLGEKAHELRPAVAPPPSARSHIVRAKRIRASSLRLMVKGAHREGGKSRKWSFEADVPLG